MKIEFGEWTPDRMAITSPGLTDAKNVVAAVDGYEPLRALGAKTAALPERALDFSWFADDNNASQTFAGTDAGLYKRDEGPPQVWVDVSIGTGYTATQWEMVRWGNWVVATNRSEAPQWIDMTSGTEFAVLANAPIAARVAVVRDFLVFGDTVEGSNDHPTRIRWSGYNNATTYGSNLATQADYQDLAGNGGKVQRIVSGATGVIFQQHSIWYMRYEGPPTVFRFDEVEPGRGTPAANSVCWLGEKIFFYSHDGFYVHVVGSGSAPIGEGKIDLWFLSTADTERLSEMRAAVDRENNLVIWSFASLTAGEVCDKLLIYHIATGKWSYGDVETETLSEVSTPGYNLDTLDNILADIDSESFNVDSRAYIGGALLIGAFDEDHKLGAFVGPALPATLETGEVSADTRTWVRSVRPLVTGPGTQALCIGSRPTLSGNVTYTAPISANATGEMPARANSRYHRFKLTIEGGFDRAHGLEVTATPEGGR